VLPSGFSRPVISYILNKFCREVLHFLIIYHEDGGSTFLRIVWYYVLDCRMSQHIFSQISQNYTEFMKAICLPYLSLADFCRHSCRFSLRIQSVGDQTRARTHCAGIDQPALCPCSQTVWLVSSLLETFFANI